MFWAAFGENCIFQDENSLLMWAVEKKSLNFFLQSKWGMSSFWVFFTCSQLSF